MTMRTTRTTGRWSAQPIAAATVLVTGLLLMAFKIRTDSEPGAIPLALVAIGIAWLHAARRRRRPGTADDARTPPG
jgi:hypothetical protein